MQSSEARFDADGDAVMQNVQQPVFEFVQAPRLTDWSQDAVVSWKKRWEQYVSIVRQRCTESGERLEVALRPVKTCVDPELLEVLCLYELRKAVDEVTSEELVTLIDAKSGSVKNAQVPDLDAFFSRLLEIDLREDDIDARVLKYYKDFATLIKENGLTKILGVGDPADGGYIDRMKLRCTVLIDNLEPKMLRDDVRRHVKYECREVRRNDFTLFGIIKKKARAQHKYHVMAHEQKIKANFSKKDKANDRNNSKHEAKPTRLKTANMQGATSGTRGGFGGVGGSAKQNLPKKESLPPMTGCWYCQGPHWLRDSRAASEEDKARALEKMKEVRQATSERVKKVGMAPAPGETLVNTLLTIPFLADTGSEETYLPRQYLDELIGLRAVLDVIELPCAEKKRGAGGNTVECREAVTLDILLQTVAGPVHLSDVYYKVMEGLESDFILAFTTSIWAPVADEDPFDLGGTAVIPPTEVHVKLEEMVTTAGDSDFDQDYLDGLREAVMEYEDVFRVDLLDDPPADVEPLRITLKPEAQPFRARPRRYSPAQSAFLRGHVQMLERNGFIYRNNMSLWACAAVPVAKIGRPNEFRLTVDYRPVNAATVPIAGTGADLTSFSGNVAGAYGFAGFDMPSGFSQLPLDVGSREPMSFVTDEGVWTPCRVPQGAMDPPLHFQNQMNFAFENMLRTNLLIWIDDILLYAPSPVDFIAALRRFFAREAKWCGRVFSGVGVCHDPERLSGLRQLPLPGTAADLQQFLCATGWMRDSLIDFSRVMQPLHDKLEAVLKVVGRTKRVAAGAALTWDTAAFEDARDLLATSQTLHHSAQDVSIVLMSDASDRGWGLVVTQVQNWVDGVPDADQQHELLVCKSGKFDDTARRWSIIEKEAFPIIWASRNLTYLLVRGHGFRIYCDHKNLVYVFAPDQEVKSHLPSVEEGVLTKCKAITRSRTRETAAAEIQMQRVHLRANGFVFPSLGEIQVAQQKHVSSAPMNVERDDNGSLTVNNRLWLPEVEVALLQRILIVAHCGVQGHRGFEPMVTTVKELFAIANLTQACRRFLSRCLLCKHVKGEDIIPRPWGPTYEATERNELLHFDFLFLGGSMGTCKYVLVLKDGLTHFCELVACDSPTSVVAATALVDWCKRFGAPAVLMSDQGSHFNSELIAMICKKLDIDQNFVVAYAPWINGTVERLNRDVLQVLRVLLMEYTLDTHEWVYMLPLVQGNLNHTPVRSLGDRSPSELFTGLVRPTPFEPILLERGQQVEVLETTALPAERLDQLRASLTGMHKEVVDQREKRRLQNMARSKGTECNFSVGDFVLWSRIDSRIEVDKLLARWVGPFEAVETAPHSFTIRHLVTHNRYVVHGSRLKFYADSSLEVSEELLAHVGNQGMLLVVESLKEHRKNRGVWQLLVSWEGLQDEEDSWEPMEALQKDVPSRVGGYVRSCGDNVLARAYATLLQAGSN